MLEPYYCHDGVQAQSVPWWCWWFYGRTVRTSVLHSKGRIRAPLHNFRRIFAGCVHQPISLQKQGSPVQFWGRDCARLLTTSCAVPWTWFSSKIANTTALPPPAGGAALAAVVSPLAAVVAALVAAAPARTAAVAALAVVPVGQRRQQILLFLAEISCFCYSRILLLCNCRITHQREKHATRRLIFT